jgi:hypothetical protein
MLGIFFYNSSADSSVKASLSSLDKSPKDLVVCRISDCSIPKTLPKS